MILENSTLRKYLVCTKPEKGPKTSDHIVKKFLTPNIKRVQFITVIRFCLHTYCHGMESLSRENKCRFVLVCVRFSSFVGVSWAFFGHFATTANFPYVECNYVFAACNGGVPFDV